MTLKTKEEYDILAKAKIDSITSRYLEVFIGDEFAKGSKYMNGLKEGDSYWDYCQRTRWDRKGDFAKFTQGLNIEYVAKAIKLHDMINELDYDRYNVLIETMAMISYAPNYEYWTGESLGLINKSYGFHDSIIGYVHAADGDIDTALQRMTGENDIFEQFAEEIRSTAF